MTHKTPPPNAKNAKAKNAKAKSAKNAANAQNAKAKNAKATAEKAKNAPAEQAKAPVQDQAAVKNQAAANSEPNAEQKAPETNAATQPASSSQPAQPNSKPNKPGNPAKRGVQRTITYIEPISALKMALIFNLALFAVWFVAMALIYIVLGAAGTWDRLDSLIGDLTDSSGMSTGMYFGGVVAIGLFEVVLFTLLAPVAALIYNASSSILGGLRIQLDR
ncbi:DUF3566 domain-containing protein [Corynebacterium jeikeium]|uniref:DUF3566 domain-containing protein n=1 Tax=Corynebacterium jeikeium TaxID=38289 RepID=UPI0001B715DA|nr:DUF3566 domain-containing protein [Corynebacterium jeikeium]EEW15649.1 hypothetical protein HMPREF0297_2022 [Corynebacterium jeikeium ATCC 43734]OOD29497.1 hypothetical protein BWP03_09800 [Corynebacterium jeikeium]WCZ52564.1 hypothetical protein CJEIK_00060 [Corynebacterium jeikeium]SUY82130.1 hypothetical membrane protein [Corynebacterium jeikeium]